MVQNGNPRMVLKRVLPILILLTGLEPFSGFPEVTGSGWEKNVNSVGGDWNFILF
jgi:hypothetical protein